MDGSLRSCIRGNKKESSTECREAVLCKDHAKGDPKGTCTSGMEIKVMAMFRCGSDDRGTG